MVLENEMEKGEVASETEKVVSEEVSEVEAVGAGEELPTTGGLLQLRAPAHFIPRRIPGGTPQDTLTCPHSMPVKNIGPGVKVVINVENLTVAHGVNSLHLSLKIDHRILKTL